jgi:RHH-type transcriptional regulator, proline utilization regulon repressor / proline dehydrogenase / delta 1-pyrroline-5-carboxylate dehydrogenase
MPRPSEADMISKNLSEVFIEESRHVTNLLEYISESPFNSNDSKSYIDRIRSEKHSFAENFIKEYSLSTKEGVAIICIVESLLRIPDKATAKELINDKLKGKNWKDHLGKSDSLFINASSWGLLLTGGIVDLSTSGFTLSKLINKIGEPVILSAIKKAIKIISNEFILGNNFAEALKNAKKPEQKGYLFSIDILGESSRSKKQADYYFDEYVKTINQLAKSNKESDRIDKSIHSGNGLSIKLSAIHPRVVYKKYELLKQQLLPRLINLIELCRKGDILITFDAEESFRQDIYLKILTDLITHEKLRDFEGIGLVLQAYQKRTFYTLDYVIELARKTGKRIPVRLVKGAYWDSEIKFCQEYGLPGYSVFTRKEYTDLSYVACAKKMLNDNSLIYPQFATHNANTIVAIQNIAKGKEFEFQKLQGMGCSLYDKLIEEGYRCRIYAPIGLYADLLAYLMRRLLENGANSSFVNMVYDRNKSIDELTKDPISVSKSSIDSLLNNIPLPQEIWGSARKNSIGYDIGFKEHFDDISRAITKYDDATYKPVSIIYGKEIDASSSELAKAQLKHALDVANNGFATWGRLIVTERSAIIRRIGDSFHENRHELYSLLMKEAGKNIEDSISEVREAIDFAYYYAYMAEQLCGNPINLPVITGERNTLTWHPRGIFACISPWNFPLAIFAGQVIAALATGNVVLAKPSENTPLIAAYAVRLMHMAGVHKNALHLLNIGGKQMSENILSNNLIKGVCFTGSNNVALSISRTLAARDTAIAPIIAETGGQNCMIVDSSALLEQATDSIVQSAFGSVGQRCSALRVLYIQEEIFEPLINLVIGAMNKLKIGNTRDFSNDIGPVISDMAKKELENHIKNITKHKSCSVIAVHKSYEDSNLNHGNFFVPHIVKITNIKDIKQENFGPILHVLSYKKQDLDKVIDEINSTGFGLTFGIQSRIDGRVEYITSRIKAGNIYANRTIIGAMVGTHPFGGENDSGTGFKAGGPHYLMKFMTERVSVINTSAIGGNVELLKKGN